GRADHLLRHPVGFLLILVARWAYSELGLHTFCSLSLNMVNDALNVAITMLSLDLPDYGGPLSGVHGTRHAGIAQQGDVLIEGILSENGP
ncbi:MAG: hypothetical protein IIB30_08285, partial [Chloroflexi bacterium]|nr:hypothetical protein [Chloroflexota bacterium]